MRPLHGAAHAAAVLILVACTDTRTVPEPEAGALVEPDVFDVIRASNSKAAVERLQERYREEVEHARLLEARIGELIAAEEALAQEHRERSAALIGLRDELRALQKENGDLEQKLAAELARREEIRKRLESAPAAPSAPPPPAKKDGAPPATAAGNR